MKAVVKLRYLVISPMKSIFSQSAICRVFPVHGNVGFLSSDTRKTETEVFDDSYQSSHG
jgi:hypothetical protein